MKVLVTHLKAPWPKNTKVGDVVNIKADELPSWALGKCTLVGAPTEDSQASTSDDKGEGAEK